MAVGICDWGIGGLGFYNLLRDDRPDLDVLYIGDQGVPGYGLFDRSSLTRRMEQVFGVFRAEGISNVVVACNAASTVVPYLDVEGVTGHGIIEPTLRAVDRLPKSSIGVIGGRRTIRSGAYRRALQKQGWDVRQRVAQPLSRRIEDGEAQTLDTQALLSNILAPVCGVDYIMLACTHYIVLEPAVKKNLPNAKVIDPATEAWLQFRTMLPPKTESIGSSRFLTTGSADAMNRQSKLAFGVDLISEEIKI